MQDITSSIYTSIIPVSDMTPLSGIPNLYDYGTLMQDIYFRILPSAIQNNLVCVVTQPNENSNTGAALLFNTTTQTIISSASLSGNIYYIYNYSQAPSLVEVGNNKYCVLDGYDESDSKIISITDFNTRTDIPSASILSIYNNNVVYTDFNSSTPIISSINVETKAVTNLSWINDAHNEQSRLIMVYETASNYVTINPTTYQVICFDKNTKNVTSTFNISAVSNAPSLSGVTILNNKGEQKIDYYLTDDKQKLYIKCHLSNGDDIDIYFILYVDPSNVNNCNIIASTISLNTPLKLSDYSILINTNNNILVKYVMGGVGNRNAVLYQLDKYNIEHIVSIPIYGYEQFTTLTNGMIYSKQPVQSAPHPFIYSIIKVGEYIGIWPKATFLRLRLLGYL